MISIIDYNAGNIASVTNVLKRLACDYIITSNPDEIRKADKIIFPGVGRAKPAMEELKKRSLIKVVQNAKQPFLGICLGLQLLADFSEEDSTKCLGIIPEAIKRFSNNLKVPQIGWNKVSFTKSSPLTDGIPDNEYFYFVNSYYMPINEFTVGETKYGISFSSVIQKDNFYATQFHPEKSGKIGEKIIRNFIEKC
ncbi:imidazole glycerol phosphate synthase subunit HisH [Patescibacteria group bacterium]|nr:imidazole glycerol phosphate synthase subunit HisH [Patescibacteria group bacterium]MBU1683713.1 imidazole glycerol phosphate synthase subunit HisH [Patescibacteria group bacterium]MBU1934510.1 imidazole glycerol phosphate synthase subunit HisH [Patescibacteria group bacterium]